MSAQRLDVDRTLEESERSLQVIGVVVVVERAVDVHRRRARARAASDGRTRRPMRAFLSLDSSTSHSMDGRSRASGVGSPRLAPRRARVEA